MKKRAALLMMALLSPVVVADTIPTDTLICGNRFDLDKAFSDLMQGQQMTIKQLVDQNRCGFLTKPMDGVEIERYGAVIKAKYQVGSDIVTLYYSAADVILSKQK